jgi:2-oxoglutarate ferredoxin oxidoreductase subunit alpha
MLGWGSTWGAIDAAVDRLQQAGKKAAHVHLSHLNPLPKNLEEVLSKFETVICPEMNDGQLVNLIRAKYLLDIKPVNKMNGVPFTTAEIESAALQAMEAS